MGVFIQWTGPFELVIIYSSFDSYRQVQVSEELKELSCLVTLRPGALICKALAYNCALI